MGKHTNIEFKALTPEQRMQIVERLCESRVSSLQNVIKRNDWCYILEDLQVSQKQVARWIREKLLDAEFATWRSRSLQQ